MTIRTRELFIGAVKRFNMLPAGSHVLCAVSGGADSVALLRLLVEYKDELELGGLEVCHINHCLRGDESDRDEQFVRDICATLGLTLHVHREDAAAYAKERGLSLEDGARKLRYGVFDKLCPIGGKIATAHTLSDSAETFIINMTRGTGIDGLTGIPPVRGNIIRPLIKCSRADIEEYLSEIDSGYVTDSTNLSVDYSRNRIRNMVIPELIRLNPSFETTLERSMSLLRHDARLLNDITSRRLDECAAGEGYDILKLSEQPELLPRLIREMGHRASAEVDAKHTGLCINCVKDGSGRVELTGDYYFYVHDGLAFFARERADENVRILEIDKKTLTELPLTVNLGNCNLSLCMHKINYLKGNYEFSKYLLKNAIDYDKIDEILVFRQHKPSDKLETSGRTFKKQVKKLISESKIPLHRRKDILVCQSGENIAWVQGFGRDNSFAPDENSKLLIVISTVND